MPSPLGNKIRELRKQKKLSLEQLAELTESSKSYIWELENKDDPKPSAEKTAKIAAVLVESRGSNGLVRLILPLAGGGEAVVVAGRDYALDAELSARIERIVGEGSVDLSVQEPPKLALVG